MTTASAEVEADPYASDGFVHIRRRPNAATIDPALCGRRGQTTVTSAWGHWGPAGKGFDQMCPKCVEVEREAVRSNWEPALPVAKAESSATSDSVSWGLVQLAALVRSVNEVGERRAAEMGEEFERLRWQLLVPTDTEDDEWIIRLGADLEIVANKLDEVLRLAIEHLRSRS